MTTTDYPDLTGDAAATVGDVTERARADMVAVLARSRAAPLPAAPYLEHADPASYGSFLHAYPPPVPEIPPQPGSLLRPRTAGTSDREVPLHDLGVVDLLNAYDARTTTPGAVFGALRDRSQRPELTGGAILSEIPGADALVAEADRRWRVGNARPLEGIFVGVKAIIDVADASVTSGSWLTDDRVAGEDATAVRRLRAAGAIPVIITATTEFACGALNNRRHGAVSNPWDRTRWTGGSSMGSAGALAAGLVPLALGTDTGGSIRVPSALCGLTGIKPTYGLVPRTGIASLSWTLDHVGPMARSADDLRVALAVMSGPDGHDPTSAPAELAARVGQMLVPPTATTGPTVGAGTTVPAGSSLTGLALGLADAWFTDYCDATVLDALNTVVDTFRSLGARVSSMEIPEAQLLHDDFGIILHSELAANQEGAMDRFDLYDIGTQVRIARGTVPAATDYLRALRRRRSALGSVLDTLDASEVDVLLTPGVGATAPRLSDATMEVNGIGHPMQSLIGRNTGIFDYLGLPAVMAPAGFADGLPIGVQLVGRPWADAQLVNLAAVLQSVTDTHQRRPDV